jgi:hypothetical protein
MLVLEPVGQEEWAELEWSYMSLLPCFLVGAARRSCMARAGLQQHPEGAVAAPAQHLPDRELKESRAAEA